MSDQGRSGEIHETMVSAASEALVKDHGLEPELASLYAVAAVLASMEVLWQYADLTWKPV